METLSIRDILALVQERLEDETWHVRVARNDADNDGEKLLSAALTADLDYIDAAIHNVTAAVESIQEYMFSSGKEEKF